MARGSDVAAIGGIVLILYIVSLMAKNFVNWTGDWKFPDLFKQTPADPNIQLVNYYPGQTTVSPGGNNQVPDEKWVEYTTPQSDGTSQMQKDVAAGMSGGDVTLTGTELWWDGKSWQPVPKSQTLVPIVDTSSTDYLRHMPAPAPAPAPISSPVTFQGKTYSSVESAPSGTRIYRA